MQQWGSKHGWLLRRVPDGVRRGGSCLLTLCLHLRCRQGCFQLGLLVMRVTCSGGTNGNSEWLAVWAAITGNGRGGGCSLMGVTPDTCARQSRARAWLRCPLGCESCACATTFRGFQLAGRRRPRLAPSHTVCRLKPLVVVHFGHIGPVALPGGACADGRASPDWHSHAPGTGRVWGPGGMRAAEGSRAFGRVAGGTQRRACRTGGSAPMGTGRVASLDASGQNTVYAASCGHAGTRVRLSGCQALPAASSCPFSLRRGTSFVVAKKSKYIVGTINRNLVSYGNIPSILWQYLRKQY